MISSLQLSVLSEISFPIVWNLSFRASFKIALNLKLLLGFCQSRFVDTPLTLKKINLKDYTSKLCISIFAANMQKNVFMIITCTVCQN